MMPPQPELLILADSPRLYELDEEYVYEWVTGRVANRIVIPAGFRFDGASVPRLAWSLTGILPDGLIRAAAMLHDWLYQHGGMLPAGSQWSRHVGPENPWRAVHGRWSRLGADRMFGAIMKECGIGWVKRWLAVKAVRIGGGGSWRH